MILCLAAGGAVTLAMLGAWFLQRQLRNAGWVDVVWTFSTGLALAAVALAAPGVGWRRVMIAVLLVVWAMRLGTHIARRVVHGPEDSRYVQMRQRAGARFDRQMIWLLLGQGPVAGLLAISVYLAAAQPAPELRLADIAGALLLAAAIVGEALADRQLRLWRAIPGRADGICEVGLWSLCRHPNYLFEALVWLAYPIIAVDVSRLWTLVSFTAPILMFLVLRYLTGVPPLEAAMRERRGESYRAYQQRTNAMWPRLRGIGQ